MLIALRVALGPLLFILSIRQAGPAWILLTLAAAMLSDIFDGVIARKLGTVTYRLRVADSLADAWFFLWIGLSAFYVSADILRAFAIPLLIELVLQLAGYTYDLIRYRKIATLHAYTAKAWGLSLYLAAGGLLAFHTGAFIWVAFAVGIASAIDAMAIKLILPDLRHDVLSAFHARLIRQR